MSLPADTDASIRRYERLLASDPDNATARFNLALLYKMARRYPEALEQYREAVRLGIDHVEEVYSNIGVLYADMRQGDRAREMYEQALSIDAGYVPALFNLAGILEESGERQRAIELYRQVLAIDPGHWESLLRLAHAQRARSADDELVVALRAAIERASGDPEAGEGLHFALGKLLDDAGEYERAFESYKTANDLAALRGAAYEPAAAEQATSMMLELFDREWLEKASTDCDAGPVFICGMFRSGSTLTEQILAAHPSLQAGGELDILPWLISSRLAPFPARLQGVSGAELMPVAGEYLARVRQLFPDAERVTDKRPDNFLHLGLIRAMFPNAKIVFTRRNRRDNCLSVYFQQLDESFGYARNLADIAHYYRQHERLMAHWHSLFGENLFTVDYDRLVREPEPVSRDLLDFLELPWDERCLDFQHATTLVKTASIWQVREPLHTRSSGRWQNYERFIDNIPELEDQGEQQ